MTSQWQVNPSQWQVVKRMKKNISGRAPIIGVSTWRNAMQTPAAFRLCAVLPYTWWIHDIIQLPRFLRQFTEVCSNCRYHLFKMHNWKASYLSLHLPATWRHTSTSRLLRCNGYHCEAAFFAKVLITSKTRDRVDYPILSSKQGWSVTYFLISCPVSHALLVGVGLNFWLQLSLKKPIITTHFLLSNTTVLHWP